MKDVTADGRGTSIRAVTKLKLTLMMVVAALTSAGVAQIAGGAASFGQSGQSSGAAIRAAELAKRNIGAKDGGRYLEAAVLMNIPADEYVAVFAVNAEGKTLEEARLKMSESVQAFTSGLTGLGIKAGDTYVDFVAQNRIYGYENAGQNAIREVVVGFEVKKTISIHYRIKSLIEPLAEVASKAGIFDLVKVDYIVKDLPKIHRRLLEEAAKVLKTKRKEQETLLGVKIGAPQFAYPAQYSVYFPVQLYNSYTAEESESFYGYRSDQTVQRARKPRTFYFDGLTGQTFDSVINPVLLEPEVQCTVYVRVKV